MKSLVAAADKLMTTVVVAALIFMFGLLFSNVVLRFAFNTGLSFAEELARYAFVWCTFLGAVLALRQNAHIGITGIRARIPEGWLGVFDAVVVLVNLIVCVIILIGAVEILIANRGGRAPVSGAPVTIALSALVVGAAAMLLVFGGRLWRTVIGDRGG